jgi:putative ABC transport system permease protein
MKSLWRKDRGTSGLIILVLALGIGGTAAIFTLLKAAFLNPLPYRDGSRLVTVTESNGWIPSVSEFLEIRERTYALDQLAFAEHLDLQLTGTAEPARVFAARVTPSFFPLLGVHAALDNTTSVVLTDPFWRSRMSSDPNVVGRTLRLDGQAVTVAGVLPRDFQFDYPTLNIPEPVEIYVAYPLPGSLRLTSTGRGTPVRVLGRLRPGVTLAQAREDLRSIARALTTAHPEAFPNPQHNPSLFTFVVTPLREAIVGTQRSLLWLLLGGVGALLLIACANAAQLLLARGMRRTQEVAIRTALGATRFRLVRQFFSEGLILAACGGAAGLLAAGSISRLLVRSLPVRNPLLSAAHVDRQAAVFTVAVSVASALLFAIVPAVKTSRLNTRTGNRWRHLMIALEAALSVFLLCGAALVAQNLHSLIGTPMGFDPKGVLAMRLKLPAHHQNEISPNAGVVFQDYLDRIAAIPGVQAAATVTGPPLRPARGGNAELVGRPQSIIAWNHLVSMDYFRALRIPLLAGRGFRRDDAGPRATVAIVNEEFARRFGFGADIVGQRMDDGPGQSIEIVGMVGTVRSRGLRSAPFPEVYLSSLQLAWANTYFVVRSNIPPATLLRQVKSAIASANSEQSVFGVLTMDDLIADAVSQPRFEAFVIGAFALLAILMAAAGMYSVISCLVAQRTGEIAIRMALGAGRPAIVRTVLGATSLWVAAGLTGGLGLALAAAKTVRTMTDSEVQASPALYAAVALFFLAVTLLAAWLPARRASALDPAVALRSAC